jgi:hypothetical protein
MLKQVRRHATYANVVATLALFLVLGGGTALASYVVTSNGQIAPGTISGHKPPSGDHANVIAGSLNSTDLAPGAVTNAKIAPNAVNSSKVADGSLTASDVNTASIQGRVTGSCTGNNALQSVAQNGSVGCNPSVSSVTAGTGLTGGTITDSGTVAVDPTVVQSRVGGPFGLGCGGDAAIQKVDQDGTLHCSAELTPASRVLASQFPGRISPGNTVTLIQDDDFVVSGVCPVVPTDPSMVTIEPIGQDAQAWWSNNNINDTATVPADTAQDLSSGSDADRGDFNIGGVDDGNTLSGSFAKLGFGNGDCEFMAEGIAS